MASPDALWPLQDRSRRNLLPGPGWQVCCPSCRGTSELRDAARCPHCDCLLTPPLPRVDAPPMHQRQRHLPMRSGVEADWTKKALAGLVVLMIFGPVGLLFFYLVTQGSKSSAPLRSQTPGTYPYTNQLRIERAWVDLTRLAGRRGLVVQYTLGTFGLVRRRLEVAVRVLGPDGSHLPSTLRRYRGDRGEILLRHQTPPLQSQSSRFPRLWLFLPTRALPLPPGTTRAPLTFEAVFSVDGKVVCENLCEFQFVPTADDFSLELPESPVEADDVVLVQTGPVEADPETTCGVCGDSLAGEPIVRCSLCDTQSHRECWEYLGGCSTYACEGRSEPG